MRISKTNTLSRTTLRELMRPRTTTSDLSRTKVNNHTEEEVNSANQIDEVKQVPLNISSVQDMKNRSETIARRNSRKLRVRGLHKKVAKAEERPKLVSDSGPPIGLVTKLVNKIPHDTEEVVPESVEGLVIPFDTADDDEVASPLHLLLHHLSQILIPRTRL